MLDELARRKVSAYIDGIILDIKKQVQVEKKSGISGRELIDRVIEITVNKVTPQSKMILSSVYNVLASNTLKEEIFKRPESKASFYEQNILDDLNKKFSFEIPKNINYTESEIIINKWIASGVIVVIGGVVSIVQSAFNKEVTAISVLTKSIMPIGISVIIAGLMAFVLKDDIKIKKGDVKEESEKAIDDYLNNVKASLMSWVVTIEKYYDQRVSILKQGLVN